MRKQVSLPVDEMDSLVKHFRKEKMGFMMLSDLQRFLTCRDGAPRQWVFLVN
jgi:hypothetical protein